MREVGNERYVRDGGDKKEKKKRIVLKFFYTLFPRINISHNSHNTIYKTPSNLQEHVRHRLDWSAADYTCSLATCH